MDLAQNAEGADVFLLINVDLFSVEIAQQCVVQDCIPPFSHSWTSPFKLLKLNT